VIETFWGTRAEPPFCTRADPNWIKMRAAAAICAL